MPTEEKKAFVRRFIDEVFNDGNVAAIPNYMRAGTLLAGNTEGQVKRFKGTFPDLHYVIQDIVAEGDTVAVYAHWTGTQTGPGAQGQPPTGRQVASTAFWFFKIRDNKIVTMPGATDRLTILEQLGVAQTPEQSAG